MHISSLSWEHVKKTEDVVKIGDQVQVKLIKIDNLGRYDFSMKALIERPENSSPDNNKNKNYHKG